jgi:hypothetical protein
MRTPLELLNEMQIASPCTAAWDAMAGDDRVRHCGQCEKKVYNLSALTAREAADLIRANEGRLCVRLYRRHDGTVLTQDCPVGLRQRARRLWRRTAALAASLAASLLAVGCGRDASRSANGSPPERIRWISEKEPETCVMGMPAIDFSRFPPPPADHPPQ